MKQANAAALPATPLAPEKDQLAAELVAGLDANALHWLSGYMAGAAAKARSLPLVATSPAPRAETDTRLTVLYGSQTGNAKRVAEKIAHQAEQAGLHVSLVRADAYSTRALATERLLYLVISTHSAGDIVEPPDDARDFMEFLQSRRAPKLPQLRYAVLALGDSSYPDFCAIGRKIDERLIDLGATRLVERGEADVDLDSVVEPWSRAALDVAHEHAQVGQDSPCSVHGGAVVTPLHPAAREWTRQRPFAAEVLLNQRIVASDSSKDVRHIELSLEGSGISYQPGDAVGVWPRQAATLVDSVLAELGLDRAIEVEHGGERATLSCWLAERRELTTLTRPFLLEHGKRGEHAELLALLEPEARSQLAELLHSHQLLDLLRRWPSQWDAASLVAALRPLAPRMYSIASSQAEVGDELHLTVARLNYQHNGEVRWGVATRHLCDSADGERISIFVEANDRFRLPTEPERDIIMIGPGTGVAPFRGFLQQRRASAAPGRNWLIFGNRQRRTDFLYQLEWQKALREGNLDRLTVAFSRDQDRKTYVQDRLREHGRELWSWLDSGAHLYLCGDADRMAPDVHRALIDLVAEHGGKSPDAAGAWLKNCLAEGRYARDVY